jgi:site-specific recombinase XerD
MKKRFRLIRRGERNTYYCFDTLTKRRASLDTSDAEAAQRIIEAKNDALRQPILNLNIARAYLAGTDSGFTTRTWRNALTDLIETKQGPTKERWLRAAKDKALLPLLDRIIAETQAEHLFAVLKAGTVSTNVHLRKLHNFAVGTGWLPWPIVHKRQWPEIVFKEKRAITFAEHQKIIAQEKNPEFRAYYEMLWHLGGSQSDVAHLCAEDVDWEDRTIAYSRMKTGSNVIIHFGAAVDEILKALPKQGPLFPNIRNSREADRGTYFKRRCALRGVFGVTLHSYRYAWAERARTAGVPERFAQAALGHNSVAVHRAYAKKANVKIPSLEDYEKKIIALAEAVNQ